MLFPLSILVAELNALFNFLLKSYSLLVAGIDDTPDSRTKLFILTVLVGISIFATVPVAARFCSFLNNISISSSILRLDLSISLVNSVILDPDTLSISNLEDVL